MSDTNDVGVASAVGFRLVVERPGAVDGGRAQDALGRGSGDWQVLTLPTGPSLLVLDEGGVAVTAATPLNVGHGVLMEPLLGRRRIPGLVAISTEPLRVNGFPAPSVAVLRIKDTFQVADHAASFHVTAYCRVRIGQPTAAQVGRECPVCRTLVTASSRVLTCPCGAALHSEENADGALQCAAFVPVCPVCRQVIERRDGYSYVPEGFLPGS